MGTIFQVLGIAFLVSLIPLLVLALNLYRKFRGQRVVTCPETCAPAGVELNAARATVSELFGVARLRLESCSRWPEQKDCDQWCLEQIESAPEGCLVRTMLARFYEGSSCVVCGTPIGDIHWFDRRPALVSPDGALREWSEITPEEIPAVLATHERLCWNCSLAESFRARFPERVLDDPWHKTRRAAAPSPTSQA
jgi:hypothetical protein